MLIFIDKVSFMEKYIIPFLAVVGTFLFPVLYWFAAIGFFIMADLMLRLIICVKKKEDIISRKLWRTLVKFGAGCIFILVAHGCQVILVPDIPMMKIIGSFLILVELKSIDEKAKELTGFSLFSLVIDKLSPKK